MVRSLSQVGLKQTVFFNKSCKMAQLLADFMVEEVEQKPMIIGRGLLPAESKLIVGGAAKSNKSYLILNIGLAIAQGTPLFGAMYANNTPVFPVPHPRNVLLIEQEIGRSGLKTRLSTILEARPSWNFVPFYIRSRDLSLSMDTPEGIAAIDREIEETSPKVLILDPLSKMHNRDENSAQEMGLVMRKGDYWISKFGVSIIYVHHTGLATFDPTNTRKGGARLRGSSVIFADVDSMIEIVRRSAASSPEPMLELNIELRQGEPLEPQYVRRRRSGIVEYLGEGASGAAASNRT